MKIAHGAEHRVLADACMVKDIFLAMLQHAPTVRTITDNIYYLRSSWADALVSAIDPPVDFEALATAITEQCAITIVYEHGWQPSRPRTITPRLLLEVHGVAYVIAHCHLSDAERTFRLDRIRECWLG
jgi:predicted DNA-binding transcriptional regulator YafY